MFAIAKFELSRVFHTPPSSRLYSVMLGPLQWMKNNTKGMSTIDQPLHKIWKMKMYILTFKKQYVPLHFVFSYLLCDGHIQDLFMVTFPVRNVIMLIVRRCWWGFYVIWCPDNNVGSLTHIIRGALNRVETEVDMI